MKHFTDLVGKAIDLAHSKFEPPVRSLMDVDFYKFTMGQLIYSKFAGTEVTFTLIVRSRDIDLGSYVSEQELRDSLDHMMSLAFSRTDLYWMRGIDLYGRYMFKEPYLDFLRNFKLPQYSLEYVRHGDKTQIELTFKGAWEYVSPWETLALGAVSELYYRGVMRSLSEYQIDVAYIRAADTLYRKLEKLSRHKKVTFADFGQRRRHSFLWQQFVLGKAKQALGSQFTGTSNTWMAFKHDLVPIGTNAHELPMVLTALANSDDEMRDAQYQVLRLWEELYEGGLRVFLPDTYGTDQFLANVPADIKLESWRGMRQDSGDPISEGNKYINWLHRKQVDPKGKLVIFSDGLDVDEMVRYQRYFDGQTNTTNGWGTLLTNDFREAAPDDSLKPFSIVCKVTEVNGRPAVKLSNNPEKATGPKEEVERYKRVFGIEGQVDRKVLV